MKGYLSSLYRHTIIKASLNEASQIVPAETFWNLKQKEMPRSGIEPLTRGFSARKMRKKELLKIVDNHRNTLIVLDISLFHMSGRVGRNERKSEHGGHNLGTVSTMGQTVPTTKKEVKNMHILIAKDQNGGTAYLTTQSPASHYGRPVLQVTAEDLDDDFGPGDLLGGIEKGSFMYAADIVTCWARQSGLTEEEMEAAKVYLRQWPEGPQV